MNFDKRQSEAIGATGNTIVMAGAGSGKTSVIAERYCRLLEKPGIELEHILALTFTQKAAAEMYERIYTRLLDSGGRLRRHLECFENAQISTLDSFCAEILSNACDRFGLPADFRYDEPAVARIAEQTSLHFLLEKLEVPAVQELLHIHGFETLWKGLFTDLALSHLHLPGEVDFAAMARAQIERCRADLRSTLDSARSLAGQLRRLEARTPSIRSAQEALAGFPDICRLLETELFTEAGSRLSRLSLRKPGGRGAEDIQRLKELIDALKDELEKLGTLAATLARQRSLLDVFSLLQEFATRFLEQKRIQGLVTFQDVEELAVQALIRDKPLRRFYKRRYRYIMIDEFQDNNRLQKDLLFLLAERLASEGGGVPGAADLEPDKLFFVGDEKQSIYRFRGAEVGVFKSLHEELASAGGRAIELDRNYRSEAGLIDFVNGVFSVVMAGARAGYEARFQAMQKGGSEGGPRSQIHLFYGDHGRAPEPAQDYASASLAEAHAVVRFIRDAVTGAALAVPFENGARPAVYDDFALLLRSTGNQIHYERMLRHYGVPYSTDNLRSLFVEAPINDFYLLLQLAVFPEDRAAYAGVLRSPFVNIGDETTARILLAWEETKGPFQDTDSIQMSTEERRRLERGKEIYLSVREAVDRVPIAELFHRLWYRFGYRYTILSSPRNHNHLEYYDYMIKLAERADEQGDSLAVFLDFLRRNLGLYERIEDLTVLKPRLPGVQLITIHGSKGLEFPIVVLADMGNLGRYDSGASKPYYVSSQYGITFNLGAGNYFTEIGEREARKEELAEIKRLMYVALTRAKSHLILAGTHRQKNRSSSRAHLNLLLAGLGAGADGRLPWDRLERNRALKVHEIEALAWKRLREPSPLPRPVDPERLNALYGAPAVRRELPRREATVSELCRHLDPLLEQRRKEKDLSTEVKRLPSIEADALLKEKGLESAFGTLTHQLLDQWGRDPSGAPPEPDWSRTGIPRECRQRLLAGAVGLCRSFFDSELGSLSGQAQRVERELPFLYLFEDAEGPLYISGQIDLCFEWRDSLYLVDFKTDSAYRPGEHEAQLGLYRMALREQTDKEIRAVLFLLRSGEETASDADLELGELISRVRRLLA